jgi:hypothetical protein
LSLAYHGWHCFGQAVAAAGLAVEVTVGVLAAVPVVVAVVGGGIRKEKCIQNKELNQYTKNLNDL